MPLTADELLNELERKELVSAEIIASLGTSIRRIYCLSRPAPFIAISLHYLDFHPLTDEEVIEALALAPQGGATRSPAGPFAPTKN